MKDSGTVYTPPPETQKLIDELYKEEVLRARRMDPVQKMLLGPQLFEAACAMTLAGIQHQNPDASPEECEQILRERLILKRKLEATS